MAKRLTVAQLSTEIEDLRARLETSQRMCQELQTELSALSAKSVRTNPAKRWEPGPERQALIAKYQELRSQGKRAVIRGTTVVTY